MSNALESFKQKMEAREAEAAEAYAELVAALARDEETAADIERVVEAAGKTAAELDADVRREQQIIAWKREAEQVPDAVTKRGQLQAQLPDLLKKREKEIEAARQRWIAAALPVELEIKRLDEVIKAGEAAKRELEKLAPPEPWTPPAAAVRQAELPTNRPANTHGWRKEN